MASNLAAQTPAFSLALHQPIPLNVAALDRLRSESLAARRVFHSACSVTFARRLREAEVSPPFPS
jgi:hypothetical protein